MRVAFVCNCGLENFNFQDWICHFKYQGWQAGMRNLLLTKIVVKPTYKSKQKG